MNREHEVRKSGELAFLVGSLLRIRDHSEQFYRSPFQADGEIMESAELEGVDSADNPAFWTQFIQIKLTQAKRTIDEAQKGNDATDLNTIKRLQGDTISYLQRRRVSKMITSNDKFLTDTYLTTAASFSWLDSKKDFSELLDVTNKVCDYYGFKVRDNNATFTEQV